MSAVIAEMPGPGSVVPRPPMLPSVARRNSTAQDRADQLGDQIAGDALPWEVAPHRESHGNHGVEVGAGHGAHEKDHRHHHQTGGRYPNGKRDLPAALGIDHCTAGRDEHQEERAEDFENRRRASKRGS